MHNNGLSSNPADFPPVPSSPPLDWLDDEVAPVRSAPPRRPSDDSSTGTVVFVPASEAPPLPQ